MNLDQLYKVKSTLERLRQEPLTISFKDFGRTNDCWIYHFPESTYESPDTIMQWRDSITVHNAFFIGHIINHTTASNNRQIEILNLSQCQIDDEILSKIINSIDGHNLKSIDLSDNNGITDESVEYLLQYISQSQLESINLYETKITDSGYDRIFSLPLLPLKNISLSFETHQLNEDQHHQFFSSIASLLRTQECVLEDLRMTGYITPVDAKEIVESLHENTSLRHLEIDSLHCEKYENPDPVIDPNIQSLYDDFTEALADAVMGEGTSCRLCSLVYPLLTEVYVFSERGMKIFADIEDKLKENMEMYGKDNE